MLGVNNCETFWGGIPWQHCRWPANGVVNLLLCSVKLNNFCSVQQRWLLLLLFQTIIFLWEQHLHYGLQMSVLYLLDVNGQLNQVLRSCRSCVGSCICAVAVWFHQSTNLPILHCTGQHKLHCCLCYGVLSLGWTNLCLSVLPGLKWTGILCLLKILLRFSDVRAM